MTSKLCGSCGETKDLSEFTQSKRQYKYTNSGSHHSYCKKCNAARAREWRKSHTNYKGTGKIKSVPKEDRLIMSAIRQRLVDARSRCKKFGKQPPTVDADYLYSLFLSQERKCALTGAILEVIPQHPLCLSLDKIEPEKGYDVGNVQWVAWCVNRAKGDLSLDHFYEMCEVVLEYRKVQRLSRNGVGSSDPKRGTPT